MVLFEGFNGASFPPSGWSTLNADGGANPPWFRGSASSAFPPFEGAGFAADNFQSRNGTRIDDWLIGPPVTGVGQPGLHDSLVFMVRSVYYLPPAVSPPDTLLVLLSAGGQGTPPILQRSGVYDAGQGFFADPLWFVAGPSRIQGSIYDVPMTAGNINTEDGIVMTDLMTQRNRAVCLHQ